MKANKTKTAIAFAISLFSTIVSASITTDVIGSWRGECVDFARSKVPSLPHGLYSLNDKLRIINSHKCHAGSVAVIDVGNSVGHVSVITACDNSGRTEGISLTEANYISGKITARKCRNSKISQCVKDLRIRGFYRP